MPPPFSPPRGAASQEGTLPRRRRLGLVRGSGTRLVLFGGWDGTATVDDMLELDTTPWLRLDGAAPAKPPLASSMRPDELRRAPAAAEEAGGVRSDGITPGGFVGAHGGGRGGMAGGGGGFSTGGGTGPSELGLLEGRYDEEMKVCSHSGQAASTHASLDAMHTHHHAEALQRRYSVACAQSRARTCGRACNDVTATRGRPCVIAVHRRCCAARSRGSRWPTTF